MKLSVKLFATISLKTGLKLVDVNVDKPVTVIEMLKIVSDIIDYDLIDELVENNANKSSARILIDDDNINYINKLDAEIAKGSIISIIPSGGT